ncbi:hypothetical protein AB6A40_002220 [Gnathostoma spinigerum]|uniref:Uncharacterized protein n=1 Tax=Gnathostoma spinigerum TaxID=75299 RepID=A0ABD6E8J5_9BILA
MLFSAVYFQPHFVFCYIVLFQMIEANPRSRIRCIRPDFSCGTPDQFCCCRLYSLNVVLDCANATRSLTEEELMSASRDVTSQAWPDTTTATVVEGIQSYPQIKKLIRTW